MATMTSTTFLSAAHGGEWTLEDLHALAEETHLRLELLDGTLLVSAAPTSRHQRAVMRVTNVINSVLPAEWEAVPGIEIQIPRGALEPDVAVVRSAAVEADTRVFVPDEVLLAAEVASPSTRRRDRTWKADAYAEAGIGTYLLVDHTVPEVVFLRRTADAYEEVARAVGEDEVVLPLPFDVRLRPAELVIRG